MELLTEYSTCTVAQHEHIFTQFEVKSSGKKMNFTFLTFLKLLK